MNEEITASEYQKLSTKTLLDEPGFEIPPRQLMIVWNVLGLVGEVGELLELVTNHYSTSCIGDELKATFEEELGDALWYTAAICTKLRCDFEDVLPPQREYYSATTLMHTTDISTEVCALAEYIKKGVFHRHGIDAHRIISYLKRVTLIMLSIYWILHPKDALSVSELFQGNLKKLHTRYYTNKGFTPEDSIKRVDVLGDDND